MVRDLVNKFVYVRTLCATQPDIIYRLPVLEIGIRHKGTNPIFCLFLETT